MKRATGKFIWLEGFRRARGEAEGNNQLFPGPTESREPLTDFSVGRGFSYYLFYYYHYMPTVHKSAIQNKLTKKFKDAFQFKIYFKY